MNVNRLLAGLLLLVSTLTLYGTEAEEIRKQLPSLKGEQRLAALGRLYDLSLENDGFNEQLTCLYGYLNEAQLQDNKKSEGEARKLRIILFYNNDQNDSLIYYAPDDLNFLRENKQWEIYYRVWSLLVNTYVYDGSVTLGMQEAEKMYADAKERNDEAGLGLAYSVMGNAYYNMNNMQEAADAYQKCIDLLMHIHPVSMDLPNFFSSYCDVLEQLHSYRQLRALTAKWKECLSQILIDWKIPEDHPGYRPLLAYYHIACAQAAIGLGDAPTAAKQLEESRECILSEEEDVYRSWLFYMARLSQRENRLQEALSYNNRLTVQTAGIDDMAELVRVKQQRAEIMMNLGKTGEAAVLYKEMYQINDSINRHDSKRKLAEMNTIFKVDELKMRQAQEQARLKMEQAEQQMRSIIIIASIIVLALIIFIYFRYRSAKRLKAAHTQLEETHNQLLTAYDQLEETTTAKERIESDLRIARNIQMGMVPHTFPDREDVDLYASMTPAKEVGGDLYDYLIIGDKLFFCLGDVSGKGVPASLFMAMARNMFHVLAQQDLSPAEIATRLNNTLSEDNESSMFVTMFIGVADLKTGHLGFCNAGHNPPVLLHDGTSEFLEMIPNAPIGLWPGMEYEGEEIADIANRPLFVYTDGLNEAENRQQEQFTDERLLEILEKTPFESSKQTIELLKNEVEKHRDGAEPNDDLTMLCVKVIK